MYHFTHGYTHRVHTRMQAIVRTYNLPVHTRMCIIMSYVCGLYHRTHTEQCLQCTFAIRSD